MADFNKALNEWLKKAQAIIDDNHERSKYNFEPDKLELMEGRRYFRVVRVGVNNLHRSAYCFVDRTNGDVLKPAGWKGPAKHARGNIFTDHIGVGPYGAHYLR